MDGGSNMKSDAQTLRAYALYLAKFVEEYAKEGITIGAVHPQNEPGYARVHWNQTLLVNFFKTYMGPTFAQREPHRRGLVRNDVGARRRQHRHGGGGRHGGARLRQGLRPAVEPADHRGDAGAQGHGHADGAPVRQLQLRRRPYWEQSQYNASKPPNDHPYGEESWQLIRDWIISGVNSYNAWNMVLDTIGKSLDGWPQDALLVVDRSAKTLTATAAYYAFRHFSAVHRSGRDSHRDHEGATTRSPSRTPTAA